MVGVRLRIIKATPTRSRAKAVIISTGGFNNSPERVRAIGSHYDPAVYQGLVPLNKTGDGIAMAEAPRCCVPGNMALMAHPGTRASNVKLLGNIWVMSWQPKPVWVNDSGKRFVRDRDAFTVLGRRERPRSAA